MFPEKEYKAIIQKLALSNIGLGGELLKSLRREKDLREKLLRAEAEIIRLGNDAA